MRQVQRAAVLRFIQVDHGIERLSRIRDHVEGPVPYAGELLPALPEPNQQTNSRPDWMKAR
jgi:hypothetical protein